MYINCDRVSQDRWQIYCHFCKAALDIIDGQELAGLMAAQEPIKCMDCDTSADSISSTLWQDETPYLLIIDGTMLGCDWPTTMAALSKTCTYLRQELYKAVNPHSLILERDFEVSDGLPKTDG